MLAHNPMARQEVREKVSATLQTMGHRPPAQGGNGRPPPEPQRRLAEALGLPMEVVVLTGKPRRPGWPTCFKIDIADKTNMVAIEVDGGNHCAKKVQACDARKKAFLQARGWTVLRFSNKQVMEDLEACVRTVTSTTSKSRNTTTTS